MINFYLTVQDWQHDLDPLSCAEGRGWKVIKSWGRFPSLISVLSPKKYFRLHRFYYRLLFWAAFSFNISISFLYFVYLSIVVHLCSSHLLRSSSHVSYSSLSSSSSLPFASLFSSHHVRPLSVFLIFPPFFPFTHQLAKFRSLFAIATPASRPRPSLAYFVNTFSESHSAFAVSSNFKNKQIK